MIKYSPLLCLALASGSGFAQTAANGQWRTSPDCVPSRSTKCAEIAPIHANQPISAAKSDAMKKRQLTDLIGMNKDALRKEQAALSSTDRQPVDRPL